MKIHLIDSHTGVVKAVVLKEWMRIGLSICLLGLPVILGYFSVQLADARNAEYAKNTQTPALGDKFDFAGQTPGLRSTPLDGEHLQGKALNELNEKIVALQPAAHNPAHHYSQGEFSIAGRLFPHRPLAPDSSIDPAAFIGSRSFHEALAFLSENTTPVVVTAAVAKQLAVQNGSWNQQVPHVFSSPASAKDQSLTLLFAKYGDVLKKGQIITLAAALAYAPEAFSSFVLHKNGRVVDPASYLHNTIR
jgi:hypothetical protein